MTKDSLEIPVEERNDGMRLHSFLRRELNFTEAQIRSLKFRENGIRVNGVRARVTRILRAGDVLSLRLEDDRGRPPRLVPSRGPLTVLYEDRDVICVDKPAGMVVHPSHGHYQDSLSNRVRAYDLEKGGNARVRSIGRLDKDTSGVVVFARNQVAAARLWEQREKGSFRKEYLAWCEGRFPEAAASVNAPIAPAEGELMRMCVSERGRRAVTHYEVLRQYEDFALVRLWLETGRTHQIRVHMSYIGHPLVSDPLYGNGTEGRDHAMLCAWKAAFDQPFTGERIEVEAGIGHFRNFSLTNGVRQSIKVKEINCLSGGEEGG